MAASAHMRGGRFICTEATMLKTQACCCVLPIPLLISAVALMIRRRRDHNFLRVVK